MHLKHIKWRQLIQIVLDFDTKLSSQSGLLEGKPEVMKK